MSENEMSLGQQFKAMLMDRVIPEIGAEMNRLGVQGTMELASALFNGQGFVPYGPGQYTPNAEPAKEQAQEGHVHDSEQQRHGRSM